MSPIVPQIYCQNEIKATFLPLYVKSTDYYLVSNVGIRTVNTQNISNKQNISHVFRMGHF